METRKVVRVLEKNGWIIVSQKGSHLKMKNNDKTVIIPIHKGDLKKGTLASIQRTTGIKF